MHEDKDRRRGNRRARTLRYARGAQRLHLRSVHPSGQVDCICEQAAWYFAKAKPFFCRRLNYRGRPKIAGLSCGPDYGLRRRVKQRIQGKRLAREWLARLGPLDPEDIDL